MAELRDLQLTWNEFGQTDPLWCILSYPDKRGNKGTRDEFCTIGIREIDALMAHLETLCLPFSKERARFRVWRRKAHSGTCSSL